MGIKGLSCALWKVAGSAIVGCAAAALPGMLGGGAGEVKGALEGTGAGGGGLGGWGVAYQCPSSTPISTTSDQASRQRDAPTLNPAKTARASLESAFLCTVCQGKGAGRGAEGKRLL